MKYFIFLIALKVLAIGLKPREHNQRYGCNNISRYGKSLCYLQFKDDVDNKKALKCCMTNTVKNKRVLNVALMQLKELNRRQRYEYFTRCPKGPFLMDHAYDEFQPICTPKNKQQLLQFYFFLKEYRMTLRAGARNRDPRWDCFITKDDDSAPPNTEHNFCRRVLNRFADNDRLEDISEELCDGTDGPIYPKSKSSYKSSLNPIDLKQAEEQNMSFLDKNNAVTTVASQRRKSRIDVFKGVAWNPTEDGFRKVLFKENFRGPNKCDKNEYYRISRQLECGCYRKKTSFWMKFYNK